MGYDIFRKREAILTAERDRLSTQLDEVNESLRRLYIARETIAELAEEKTIPPTELACNIRLYLLDHGPHTATKIARGMGVDRSKRNAIYMTLVRRPQWFAKCGDGVWKLTDAAVDLETADDKKGTP